MIFPKAKHSGKSGCLRVPKLDGGVNQGLLPHQLADTQLADCRNMWWKDGALRSRPGFRQAHSATLAIDRTDTRNTDCLIIGQWEGTLGGVTGRRFVRKKELYLTPSQTLPRVAYTTGVIGDNGQLKETAAVRSYAGRERYSTMLCAQNRGDLGGDGSLMFVNEPDIWIPSADGTAFQRVDTSQAYVPLVLIDGKGYDYRSEITTPARGTPNEAFNMLSGWFRAWYTTDGSSNTFRLPKSHLDDQTITVTYKDGNGTHVLTQAAGAAMSDTVDNLYAVVSRTTGSIAIYDAVNLSRLTPPAFIENNLEVKACRTEAGMKERICGMTIGVWFGGDGGGSGSGTRLFVSGNTAYRNVVHWSEVNNPLYFPTQNYAYIGDDTQAITALARQGSSLVIFKERELYYTTYESGRVSAKEAVRDEAEDTTYANTVYFPLIPIHPCIGCDCPQTIVLCGDRLVWCNSIGRTYMLVGSGNYQQRSVRALSAAVEPMWGDAGAASWQSACAAAYAGRYMLLLGGKIWLFCYDTRAFLRYTAAYSDEDAQLELPWFCWELAASLSPRYLVGSERQLLLIAVVDGQRYATLRLTGDKDEVLSMNEAGTAVVAADQPVDCGFLTKCFDFELPEQHKTVQQVSVALTGGENAACTVTYVTPHGQHSDTLHLSGQRQPYQLYPQAARVESLALQIDGTAPLQADSLCLSYHT